VDVRPLIAKDAAALDVWFIAQGRRSLSATAFLGDDHVIAIGAFVDDDLTGAAWGYRLARPDGKAMALLHDVEVEDPHRRKGLGKALVEAFREQARSEGCGSCWVITEAANDSATAMCTSAGAERADDRVVFHWDLAR
jgi:ribosomal-protein-alanine N-acetyltransferase